MKRKITFIIIGIVLIFLLNTVVATENKFYELKLNYDNGALIYKGIVVKPGMAPDRKVQPEIGYKCELISFANEVIDSFKFEIPLTIFTDEINPETGEIVSGIIQLNKTDFILRIPYFGNGKTIKIYDPNDTKVLEVDVGYFADVCGDDICESHESYENCPQDCSSGSADDYCDGISDSICDPDCTAEEDADCKQFPWMFVIGIGFAFFVILFIIYKIRKKKEWKELYKKYER